MVIINQMYPPLALPSVLCRVLQALWTYILIILHTTTLLVELQTAALSSDLMGEMKNAYKILILKTWTT
jgi:hypothetical protein